MNAFGQAAGDIQAGDVPGLPACALLIVANNAFKYVADVVTDFGDLPPVWCHLGDINQVLLNRSEERRVGKEGTDRNEGRGTKTVRTSCDGTEVVIELADTGRGMRTELGE